MKKPPKPKICKYSQCKKPFTPNPFRFNQQTCDNIICALGYSKEKIAQKETKAWNAEKKVIKAKMMSKEDHLQDLQKNYFNPFIRLRDKGKPCISCKTPVSNKWDAGHWWPAGNYSYLRFHEDNVHSQCSFNCNRSKHGNVGEYRINLIERIGLERVLWLEENRHKELDLTVDEIKALKEVYKQKIKELKTNP